MLEDAAKDYGRPLTQDETSARVRDIARMWEAMDKIPTPINLTLNLDGMMFGYEWACGAVATGRRDAFRIR